MSSIQDMATHEQNIKSKVLKVESVQSWDNYINQAKSKCTPIIVHFSASWCMPSVVMKPYFEELAFNYPDVLFLTVDVDDVQEVAARMEVNAMPTFVLLKEGAQVDTMIGANPEELRKRVDNFVQSKPANAV